MERAHRLTQNQTSCSNLTQKLMWVLGDKIIDLLRASQLLVATRLYDIPYKMFSLF